jgi:enoyl-CoA hydratase
LALADDISIRIEGRAGRITLTRPQALNALTYDMAMAIEQALLRWREDDGVSLAIIDAQGERAFCAGGDIGDLYERGKAGDYAFGRRFWSDEYRLNALIASWPKPYVALMQGFVMGGGVGISCHGSHRIACETTRIAMPECGIGLVPDVGGSYLLAHAPGRCGEYLGLAGARMDAADAILAGFCDHFVPQARWGELTARLIRDGDASIAAQFAEPAAGGTLAGHRGEIDRFFSHEDALSCVHALEADGDEFASAAAKAIRRACPLSVACAFELIAMNRGAPDLRTALDNELRFTWRSQSHGEFVEGVRAQIIDKDRNPRWKTPLLEDVTRDMIAQMLAPLPASG